jgi:hypothetical protein
MIYSRFCGTDLSAWEPEIFRHFIPGEKLQYSLNQRLDEPQSGSGRFEEKKNHFEHRTVSNVTYFIFVTT